MAPLSDYRTLVLLFPGVCIGSFDRVIEPFFIIDMCVGNVGNRALAVILTVVLANRVVIRQLFYIDRCIGAFAYYDLYDGVVYTQEKKSCSSVCHRG